MTPRRLILVTASKRDPIRPEPATPVNRPVNALIDGVQCSHKVRCVTLEGNPWFVAGDVFNALSYSKGSRTYHLNLLHDDERGVSKIQTPSGRQMSIILSEAGLYKLIMRSDKPVAKPFQDWVTREVLPSIRKTGGYRLRAGETLHPIVPQIVGQAPNTAINPQTSPRWSRLETPPADAIPCRQHSRSETMLGIRLRVGLVWMKKRAKRLLRLTLSIRL